MLRPRKEVEIKKSFVPVFSEYGKSLILEIKKLFPYPVLLLGDTGWGKSVIAREIAKQLDLKFIPINGHPTMDMSMLVGLWRPVQTPNGITVEWQDGLLTTAIREGNMFLFEELTRASGEAVSRLFGVLDSSDRFLSLPEAGQINVPIHENFWCLATGNQAKSGYSASKLDKALESRFEAIYTIEQPLADESAILKNHPAIVDIDRFMHFVTDLRKSKDNVQFPTRELVRVARLTDKKIPLERALEMTLRSKYANNWEGIKELFNQHFMTSTTKVYI